MKGLFAFKGEEMNHLGDITKIDWASVPPVDCVTGGSPCQDLSIAGKRAGLAGERSGLYMDQINGVKELRKADEQRGRTGESIRPRYMVWENVVGAFSSNKGADFAAVLTEAVRVVEPNAPDVPVPENGWSYAGTLMGRGWSIAWRTHDAQYWGVPQRRRRISLVCDFGGATAPEILFERKSVSGNPAAVKKTRKATARNSGLGIECAGNRSYHHADAGEREESTTCGIPAAGKVYSLRMRSGCPGGGKRALIQVDLSGTLGTGNDQTVFTIDHVITTGGNCTAQGPCIYENIVPTEKACGVHAGFNQNSIFCLAGNFVDRNVKQNGRGVKEGIAFTLNTVDKHAVCVAPRSMEPFLILNDQGGSVMDVSEDVVATLRAQSHGHEPLVFAAGESPGSPNNVVVVFDARGNGDGKPVPTLTGGHQNRVTDYTAICIDCRNSRVSDVSGTLQAKGNGGQSLNYINPVLVAHPYQKVTVPLMANSHPGSYCGQDAYTDMLIVNGSYLCNMVRRLTPLECERLQGFPDGWTDIGDWVDSKGKKHKSSDSPRYKALGNSIALPFWYFLTKRISAQYTYRPTLFSLFDGIGGFPLCWESVNGEKSALWASEIDEFPIAVTRFRFGMEGENQ